MKSVFSLAIAEHGEGGVCWTFTAIGRLKIPLY